VRICVREDIIRDPSWTRDFQGWEQILENLVVEIRICLLGLKIVGTCLVGVVGGLVSVVWLLPPPRRLFFFLEPKGFEDDAEDAPKRKSSYDVMLPQCATMRYNTNTTVQ